MAETETQKNDEFYEDLDHDKVHASCCSCQTLALLFGFIFVILIASVIYLYTQFTSDKIQLPLFNNAFSGIDIKNNLANLRPDNSGQVEIDLSEKDLTKVLEGGISVQSFILKDVQTAINPDEIIVYGTLIEPINSKIVVGLVPTVQNDKIVFAVKSLSAGTVKLPDFILKSIEQNVSDSINSKFSLVYAKMNITDVFLQDHQMVIKGSLK